MNLRLSHITLLALLATTVHAQKKMWTVEAEDAATVVSFLKDGIVDIIAPKGMTLWYNKEMQGNTTIDYDAQIVSDPQFRDNDGNIRISDLNCFWMASDVVPSSKVQVPSSKVQVPSSKVQVPSSKIQSSVLKGIKQRGGKFLNSYTMQLYYMGYGGNWNTTTRFRRYDGDDRGVTDAQYRPRILKEYTDEAHLLKPDHWYHIHLEQKDGRVLYAIDGDTLVNYLDPQPLTRGHFGFRTTLSHARLRNFRFSCTDPDANPVPLRWIGNTPNTTPEPVTFGVPFSKGEKTDDRFTLTTSKGEDIPFDTWRLASWPDGSAKWQAFAAVIPSGTDSCLLYKEVSTKKRKQTKQSLQTSPQTQGTFTPSQIHLKKTPPRGGGGLFPLRTGGLFPLGTEGLFSLTLNGQTCRLLKTTLEQQGNIRTTWRYDFDHAIVRTYHYKGSNRIKLVHTLLVDSALNQQGLHELSLHFKVPMHGKPYERYVQFDDRQPMSVQPLIARRKIDLAKMDSVTQSMLDNIAQWDGFRLSQLSPNGYSVRKRTTSQSPWIGTIEGTRSNGCVTVGDSTSATTFRLDDFWQSYPSTLQVDDARTDSATVTISLYSPEAEPYSFAHYDTIPHTLEAAYEDVQPGMSTAWGIARTSTILIENGNNSPTLNSPLGSAACHKQELSTLNSQLLPPPVKYIQKELPLGGLGGSFLGGLGGSLLPSPEYLHRKRAFGIWSLPDIRTDRDNTIETAISGIMDMYDREIERNGWYGFFNYGDVMHSYDDTRGEWRYDVGGFAWDNTELGSPAMFWYQFLRTGSPKVWRMATAMTRHCSEVDSYHLGPHAGLGSRHNVVHWGCGAKEARISEAWWNRFMYYLTADERLGDIMHEVADADTLLYTLDPMRLAQPRHLYPCTAPARLRIGPDWLGYASNWLTEIERSPSDTSPSDTPLAGTVSSHVFCDWSQKKEKLLAGMNSIVHFRHGFFEGPKALGYDPATGIITNECDSTVQHTNHLLTIMGGFEFMNELEEYFLTTQPSLINHHSSTITLQPSSLTLYPSTLTSQFFQTWLTFCKEYKQKAWQLSRNRFRIPRLQAYAAWRLGDDTMAADAWDDLLRHIPAYQLTQPLSSDPTSTQQGAVTQPRTSVTNDCATWVLDAIFIKEVAP